MILVVGFLFLLYMFPASLAMSITKWSKEPITKTVKYKTKSGQVRRKQVQVQPELTMSERLVSCCPVLSACQVWKTLYGSFGWTKFIAALIPVGIVFRVIVVFLTENTLLYIISFYALWVCIILHQLLYTIVYFVTARMYTCGIITKILCIIIPEFAAYPLVSTVPGVIKEIRKEDEETVGE